MFSAPNVGTRPSSSAAEDRSQSEILPQAGLAQTQEHASTEELQEEEKKYRKQIKEAEQQGNEDMLVKSCLEYVNFLSLAGRNDEAAGYLESVNALSAPPLQKNSLSPSTSRAGAVSKSNSANATSLSAPAQSSSSSRFFSKQQHAPIKLGKLSPEKKEVLLNEANQILEQFMERKTKRLVHLHELVALASIDDLALHRDITNAILKALKVDKKVLFDLKLLQGLSVMLLSRSSLTRDTQFAGDCVVLLEALLLPLKKIQVAQNTLQVQTLLQTVSLLLDQMVSAEIQDVHHEAIRRALSEAFNRFRDEPEFSWQIKYAEQALAHLSDNEKLWNKVSDRLPPLLKGILHGAGGVLKIIAAGMANPAAAVGEVIIAGLEPDRFLNALDNFHSALDGIYPNQPEAWYSRLRWLDVLLTMGLATGRLDLVEIELNKEAQANTFDKNFLLGFCDRLERLASAQLEKSIQKGALSMLEALEQGTIGWDSSGAAKDYAKETLTRIKERQNLTLDQMEEAMYAPLPWDAFWKAEPKGELRAAVRSKAQWQALPSQITGLQQEFSTLNAQAQRVLNTRFENISIDTAQSMTQVQAIAADLKHTILEEIGRLNKNAINARNQPLTQLGEEGVDLQQIDSLQTSYLKTLTEIDEINDALKHYVEPEGQDSAYAKVRFPLLSKVQEFFASNKKVFLLLGEAGAGKSTFNRYLTRGLWEGYRKDTSQPIPLFIALAEFPPSGKNEDLIEKYLLHKGFKQRSIDALRQEKRFIFILDGFDEIKYRYQEFYGKSGLARWNAQVIISARRSYLGNSYQNQFRENGQASSLQECSLAPISDDWIKKYIQNFVEHAESAKAGWSVAKYQASLKKFSTLKEAIQRPFLLRMALEVLPTLPKQEGAAFITRIALYEAFIKHWWTRSEERLQRVDLTSVEADALAILGDNLIEEGIGASQEMAVAFAKVQATQSVDETGASFTTPLAWFGYSKSEAEKRLLLFGAPLIRDGQQYRFIHKSIQDYLVARAIWSEESMNAPLETLPTWEQVTNSVHQLKQKNPVLNDFSLVDEPLIRDFLVERIRQQPKFKDRLSEWINSSSKIKEKFNQGAANSITLLVQSGENFNRKKLANIQISGADISYGKFDHADLSGADMSKVTAIKTWFREANLTGANLSEIRFGEMPYITANENISAVTYSRNGSLFAIAWWGGKIDICEMETGRKILTVEKELSRSLSLNFSADDSRLVAAGEDGQIYVLDIENKKAHILKGHPGEGHTGAINSVSFSADRQYIVSAGQDCQVRIWNSADDKLIHKLQGHTGVINSVNFSADGQYIVSAGQDRQVLVWNSALGKLIHRLEGHTKCIRSVDFSADGKLIASGGEDDTVCVWDREKGEILHILKGHAQEVTWVQFSANDKHIVSADAAGTIEVWDTQTANLLDTLVGSHHDSDQTILSADARFAALKEESRVKLWEVNTSFSQKRIDGHTYPVNAVSTAPKSPLLISAGDDGKICIWNAKTAQLQATLSQPEWSKNWNENRDDWIKSVCLSPDGQYIASAGSRGRVVVWNAKTNQRLSNWQEGHNLSQLMRSINFSANGERIVAGGEDGKIRVWDTETATLLWTSKEKAGEIRSVSFSANGKRIIASGVDGKIRIWDAEKYELLWVSKEEFQQIYSVSFSANGEFVVSAGEDNLVRIWAVKEGTSLKALRKLEGHTSSVISVSFSADGQFIASASCDRTVRVWDAKRGTCLMVIEGSQDGLSAVAWQQRDAGDGYALITGDQTGAVILWHLPKIEKGAQAHLVWATGYSSLTLNRVNCEEAEGLGEINALLLKQGGGLNVPGLDKARSPLLSFIRRR